MSRIGFFCYSIVHVFHAILYRVVLKSVFFSCNRTLKKAPNAIKEIRKFAQKAMGTKDVRVDVNTSGAEASEVSQGGLEFALLAREMMMKMQKKSSTLLLLLLKSHWKG
ncbi:60S ribosomal protein L31 [Camellia lanceoleosa]|uniref:60S ribosomal protein L31 n=1 Tax=Camellia lanceoleosa TaxID=1840588 RepID=A0ACC0FL89_9ERIC|nr:60S ribosomal protein L31 [Camellia lanceoleosa]